MAFANEFPQGHITSPLAVRAATPSDAADLDSPARAIMLPTAGKVRITTLAGDTVTFSSGQLTAGVQYYMPIKKVHDTGTDSGLVIYIWQDK